jgi:hypothetical protein
VNSSRLEKKNEQYVDRRWEAVIQVKWLALVEKRKMQKIQMEGVV